jgi:hypothetical protein
VVARERFTVLTATVVVERKSKTSGASVNGVAEKGYQSATSVSRQVRLFAINVVEQANMFATSVMEKECPSGNATYVEAEVM